jgi:hypothetical protein
MNLSLGINSVTNRSFDPDKRQLFNDYTVSVHAEDIRWESEARPPPRHRQFPSGDRQAVWLPV